MAKNDPVQFENQLARLLSVGNLWLAVKVAILIGVIYIVWGLARSIVVASETFTHSAAQGAGQGVGFSVGTVALQKAYSFFKTGSIFELPPPAETTWGQKALGTIRI